MNQQLTDWLSLALTPGIGPVGFLRLLESFGSAGAVLNASRRQLEPFIDTTACNALLDKSYLPSVESARNWVEQPGCALMTLLDDDYPEQLANSTQPPPLLFLRGRRELLRQPMLAIVGSRHATPAAEKTATDFAARLSESGYTVVSGLAAGIDAAAHKGALTGSGSTVAIIGTGIDRIYPAGNKNLAHQIADTGLIISEFPLGMQPLPGNFPRRNRIIAGLSRGCLVVEATLKSGSLITARLAMENGRDVFAVPGSIHNPQARGCHKLIKDGAKLVENVSDILDELPPQPTDQSPDLSLEPESTESLLSQDAETNPILTALGYDPVDIDTLTVQLGLTLPEVYAMLLDLELAGKVASLPGGRYQRLL